MYGRVLSFLIRHFSKYYTLHRSDLAAWAAPLDPRLYNFELKSVIGEPVDGQNMTVMVKVVKHFCQIKKSGFYHFPLYKIKVYGVVYGAIYGVIYGVIRSGLGVRSVAYTAMLN